MPTHRQRERDIINPETEMHYAILSGYRNTVFPHSHDYFECSLLTEGDQLFVVNQQRLTLKAGTLILIRPNDVHAREYITKGNHINIAFSSAITRAMFEYLGGGFPYKELLSAATPPFLVLNHMEMNRVRNRMNELYAVSLTNTTLQRTMLRTLIMDIFVQYFSRCVLVENAGEDWFSGLLHEMERPKNLMRGLPALLEMSGRSHEHLCRLFKQRLNVTPTEYINDLRLNYAANYLIHSDLDIMDICFNAGFESVSHFYHMFTQKFGMAPRRFRLAETKDTSDVFKSRPS